MGSVKIYEGDSFQRFELDLPVQDREAYSSVSSANLYSDIPRRKIRHGVRAALQKALVNVTYRYEAKVFVGYNRYIYIYCETILWNFRK